MSEQPLTEVTVSNQSRIYPPGRPVSAPPVSRRRATSVKPAPTPPEQVGNISFQCTCMETNPTGSLGGSSARLPTTRSCPVHPNHERFMRIGRDQQLTRPVNEVNRELTMNYDVDFGTAMEHYGPQRNPYFDFPDDLEEGRQCNITHRHDLIIRNSVLTVVEKQIVLETRTCWDCLDCVGLTVHVI